MFMPQPAHIKDMHSFEAHAIQGVFLGWHLKPGGEWSGDYYVAEVIGARGFHANINASPADVTIHRVKEVVKPTEIIFPVAVWRKQWMSRCPGNPSEEEYLPHPDSQEAVEVTARLDAVTTQALRRVLTDLDDLLTRSRNIDETIARKIPLGDWHYWQLGRSE